MDMKKLLQVIDGSTQKPVEGSNDIKKALEIITEGANPHKVSLPVQMAMQHFQKPVEKKVKQIGLLQQYFENVELENQQKLEEKREQLRMYSKKIAERVLVKEGIIPFQPEVQPEVPANTAEPIADPEGSTELPANPQDTVTLDIPLMIRLLEYAREDAQTDMDLHNVAEMLIQLSENGETLSMDNYDVIVGTPEEPVAEVPPVAEPVAEACWKNYKQIGMKKKGSKTVPNCVPKK